MCQQKICHSKKVKTPVSALMAKFIVILVAIFLSAECAAGSCLSYGHACWGAHGKRSGSQEALAQRMDNEATSGDEAKAEWFLSKIVSPLDFRFYRDAANNDLNAPKPEIDDLFTDIDNENIIKSGNELEKIRQIIKSSRLAAASLMDNPRSIDVIKAPKFLEKRSTKLQ